MVNSAETVFKANGDVFTYHGEDGILLWLLNQLKNVPHVFTDIGSGDCVKSNCALLAYFYKWHGVFIDMNPDQLDVGRRFYSNKMNPENQIKFIEAFVSPDSCNNVIFSSLNEKETGILSIDIDGNDFWVWKAIDVISPRIVIIEAKVEFGFGNRVVPYGGHNHHSIDSKYNGASVEALQKLGKEKGYKLVAANKQGYNLFFVKQNEPINELPVSEALSDAETQCSFYPASFFNGKKFEKA